MISRNRNFITAYILLVGLPVLILVGVLKTGGSLSPPLSIDGIWRIQGESATVATLLCLRPLADPPEISISISQSGRLIELAMGQSGNMRSRGVLEGNTITASSLRPAISEGCARSEVALTANVDPNTKPRSLTGTLSTPGCSACADVVFRAVRQPHEKP
jgi:hypothetical protein